MHGHQPENGASFPRSTAAFDWLLCFPSLRPLKNTGSTTKGKCVLMMPVSKLCLVIGLGFDAFNSITSVSPLTLGHASLVPLSRPDTRRVPIRSNVSVAVTGDHEKANCVLQCPVVEHIAADPSNVIVSASWDTTVISACTDDSAEVSVWASPRAKPPIKVVCSRGTDSCVVLAQLPGCKRLVCTGANLYVVANDSPLAATTPPVQSASRRPDDGGQCWTVVSHLPTTGVPACVGSNTDGTVFWVQAGSGKKAVLQMLKSCDGRLVEPVEVPLPFSGEVAVRVACGSSHALILGETGSVYSMGLGSRGQLGHGSILSSSAPQLVEALAGLQVVAVEAGGWHSLALSSCGDIYTWGWNHDGQLGLGVKGCSNASALGEREVVAEPSLVTVDGCDDHQFVNASCGSRHTVAVSADLRVWGWGWSAYGQVGMVSDHVAHPVEISMDCFTVCGWEPCSVQCGPWNTFVVMSQSLKAPES